VHNGITIAQPEGDAQLALINMCKPTTSTELHDLEQQFYQCTVTEEKYEPAKWFAKLEHIRLQLRVDHNYTLHDNKMNTQILFQTKIGIMRQ
jgi:hypothetical protein